MFENTILVGDIHVETVYFVQPDKGAVVTRYVVEERRKYMLSALAGY